MGATDVISNSTPRVGTFTASTVLNTIVSQATGKNPIETVSTADFVSIANTALGINTDALLSAISQVLSRTIFSIRPYSRKFKGLYMDSQRFGNHTRKLNIADSDWNKDLRYDLTDGQAVDDQIVRKPNVLQTNFYGQNIFERQVTIFKDQLNIALSSEEEFQRFITMVMTNASDQIEQAHESTARMTLANFIGGKVKGDTANVYKLVTIYNDVAGTTLDTATVRQPENFVPFMKWAVGFIKTISDRMTNRSQKFHINVTGKEISRHTPYNKQKLYLYSELLNDIDASVMTSIFNDEYLKFAEHERVSFWQSIDSPDGIKVKPAYLLPGGTVKAETEELAVADIFGVLFDEEAVGITTFGEWSAPSPFNARGGYSNIFWHFNDRYFNDFTENGVVFLLA
ncbi:MAG: hypothetical protein DBY32_06825 [Phascolarctobacterium sp.]|nr:MAG: hypothetical protein DBY32_06825 [Phascolarctobacterium sp.]